MQKKFDAIVVGAGQAGAPLAGLLAEKGQKVALIEKGRLGGTCVNTGCIPTKALVASARVAHLARRSSDFGIDVPRPITVDMPRVKARMRKISEASREHLEARYRKLENVTLFRDRARLKGPNTVSVSEGALTAGRIYLNVGLRPTVPPIPGLQTVEYLTHESLIELETLPDHLVIVGGGPVGLELGQIFRRFGSQVTIIEKGPHLAPSEDPDVSDALRKILEDEGIVVRTDATCIGVEKGLEGIAVSIDSDSSNTHLGASHVLVAAGRRPNTDDLGLDEAGVEVDELGFIETDDHLRTSVPSIWALGDCNGRGAFTHTSYNDFEIVAANLLKKEQRSVADRTPCHALYTDPPLGRAGLTETQARKAGYQVLVATLPMQRVGRAYEKSETQGFMKVVADAKTQAILGASILGVRGDEAIHAILAAMNAGSSAKTIAQSMYIHPTVCELLPTLMKNLAPVD